MSNPVEDSEQIAWQAFRYVAGEMNEQQSEDFEQVLDQRQTAREMVAQVIELVESIRWRERSREPVVVAGTQWQRVIPIGWMSLGAAACLLFMVGFGYLSEQPGSVPLAEKSPASPAQTSEELPTEVALAAVQLSPLEFEFAENWDDEPSYDETELDESTQTVDDVAIPAWMVTAVSSLHHEEGVPQPQENQ